ncbi:barstar family protein [Streptomyces pharetrae]|jgi:RNAse (barnase) inhibitor barstar|uniref:barstar family protein n=1 Tax=Streptomyces pharetrae TaxID=291370 RepID=UPI0036632097
MDDFLDLWVDLDEILPWLPNEPYFVQVGRRHALMNELARAQFSVIEVDLVDVRSERDLLVELGQALSAPDYYGKNWDALRDILRDRGAGKPFSLAVVFSSSNAFHEANVHEFVRSVSLLQMMARTLSDEDSGQLELFYLADWVPAPEGAAVQA